MGVPSGPLYIDDAVTFTVITHRNNGVLADADGVPTYRLYEDETGTPILTGSMAKLDDSGTTGFYSEQITLSAANGFEAGKSYAIYVTATVQNTTGGQTLNFKVNATAAAGSAPTAAQVADAVWDEVRSDHTTAGTFGQGAASVQGNVTGSVGSVTGAVGSVTGSVASVTGAVGSVTGNVGGNVTGSVGSVVGLTASNLDATVSSRLASASYTAPDNASITAIKAKTDSLTFSVAGVINSNINYVNGIAVTGSGTTLDPWGPA